MKKSYVIWDKLDGVIHRGPMLKQDAFRWMTTCRQAFTNAPRPEGVDEIWEAIPVSTPKVFRVIARRVAIKIRRM